MPVEDMACTRLISNSKLTLSLKSQVMERTVIAAYIEFGSGMNKLNHLNDGLTSDGVR